MTTSNLKNRVMARIYLQYAKDTAATHPDFVMLGLFFGDLFWVGIGPKCNN